MFKNSDTFFHYAKEYQDKRKGIIDNYEKKVESLEDAKGSKYYTDELKKAEDARDESIKILKGEYIKLFKESLDSMRKSNGSRKINPPTDEELRILQLLKMKEKPTEEELRAAANTLKGNATCLSVLSEISHKAGYLHGYMNYSESNELPVEMVDRTIKEIAVNLRDFMDHDTSRIARIVNQQNNIMHGTNEQSLKKRRLFDTKEDCFATVCGIPQDNQEAFFKAID